MFKNKNKNKKRKIHNLRHHEHRRKFLQKITFAGVILMFLLASFAAFENNVQMRISILETKQHAPFNGTVNPVNMVPNWSKLASSEWNLNYDSLSSKLISIPKYDPNILKTPFDSLKYGNPNDDAIRNAKITYPVPYLGGYKLDGLENSGSHPAIDIKIPIGTPMYAIANGIVVKTANLSSGFGNHIVLMHENVPSLPDPSKKITLYSAYAHLSQILVAEGDTVVKGQKIGLSGKSGLASAPHLHFQMDTELAPWHPYWPFTNKDISDAGLKGFNDAVNTGLGKDKALTMTINSMAYVQKYLSYTPTDTAPQNNDQNNIPQNNNSQNNPQNNASNTTNQNASDITFKITAKKSYMWNEGVVFAISIYSGDNVYTGSFDGAINISLSNFRMGMLDKTTFISSDFTNGSANVTLINPAPGTGSISIDYNGRKFISPDFEISAKGFNPNERVIFNEQIRSDLTGSSLFADISNSFPSYRALQYLKNKGVISGYSDNTFRPDQVVTRAEALKLIFGASGTELKPMAAIPFKDVKTSDWFAQYVMTGFYANIVQGYSDNTFKPANTVNKGEFLKMLFAAMKVDINPLVASAPYSDVLPSDWFAPYVSFAKDKNFVSVLGDKFNPSEGMKRKDVAEVIYRVMVVKETNAEKYTEGLAMAQ